MRESRGCRGFRRTVAPVSGQAATLVSWCHNLWVARWVMALVSMRSGRAGQVSRHWRHRLLATASMTRLRGWLTALRRSVTRIAPGSRAVRGSPLPARRPRKLRHRASAAVSACGVTSVPDELNDQRRGGVDANAVDTARAGNFAPLVPAPTMCEAIRRGRERVRRRPGALQHGPRRVVRRWGRVRDHSPLGDRTRGSAVPA